MTHLLLSNIHHRLSESFSLQIERLEMKDGEILCLLGPSGCGKSTTLRMVAGLESPVKGNILIRGHLVAGEGRFVEPEDRRVGLVFQDYALFPHLTVADNVAFGLDDLGKSSRKRVSLAALEQVGLANYADKYPHMLSGGEQQRVALARALAPNPHLVLMDEPFSGLDTVLKDQVRENTFRLLKETGTTVLMVTHDPEEAMRMADKIVLMKDGQIIQQGTPAELYSSPVNEFVASFLGRVNKVPARAVDGILETELGQVAHPQASLAIGECEVLVRPEAIRLQPLRDEGEVPGKAIFVRNLGPYCLIDLELPSGRLVTARAASVLQPEVGETLSITLDRRQVFLFEN
ncbi:ABC transporter ATP-binding protein [Sneathiella limimaris]|uniref:ABC transporter ATP-binding protein n=1 Tax=Sneathiella limimaris TaxID=1964213 RepID=UPI00146EEE5A|nr:ABC transporter ATP-binding protein [Sneathiella limimaris]